MRDFVYIGVLSNISLLVTIVSVAFIVCAATLLPAILAQASLWWLLLYFPIVAVALAVIED